MTSRGSPITRRAQRTARQVHRTLRHRLPAGGLGRGGLVHSYLKHSGPGERGYTGPSYGVYPGLCDPPVTESPFYAAVAAVLAHAINTAACHKGGRPHHRQRARVRITRSLPRVGGRAAAGYLPLTNCPRAVCELPRTHGHASDLGHRRGRLRVWLYANEMWNSGARDKPGLASPTKRSARRRTITPCAETPRARRSRVDRDSARPNRPRRRRRSPPSPPPPSPPPALAVAAAAAAVAVAAAAATSALALAAVVPAATR